jgi:hypothetical protein
MTKEWIIDYSFTDDDEEYTPSDEDEDIKALRECCVIL